MARPDNESAAVADDSVRLERAEKALVAVGEATHTFQTPYITFLLLGTYIGVIIASTTDEQLLRGTRVAHPGCETAHPRVLHVRPVGVPAGPFAIWQLRC